MAAGFQGATAGPSYISARSADVILSDVRPIKLVYEALQAVNVLLDELLYAILGVSRSLATDKLKAALLRVIPTNLGKEALLEAEVELKSYWDRNTAATSGSGSPSRENGGDQFDLQWCFELLRLKCEAYSTMNDSDENVEAEARLNERMKDRGAAGPPSRLLVAPAALYLTAVLESICEHVLSNVSSVAARDSSRTLATIQDLYVALCEDDAIYGTFKTMKVYDQIEVLTKAQRPRRSKSFSRNNDRVSSPTPTSSAHGELASLQDSTGTPSRVRMSSESLKSSATAVGSTERRTSMEKGRGLKQKLMSHSRSSSEKESGPEISRAVSESGMSRASADLEEDDLQHEFDELMRSGATMKVSLTPDRLKSMEIYNRERTQRANRRGPREAGQIYEGAASDEASSATATPQPAGQRTLSAVARPVLRHVDSINEDEEEPSSSGSVPGSVDRTVPRTRQSSKSFLSRATSSASVRTRSISISDMPHPRHENSLRSSSVVNQAPASSASMSKVSSRRSAPRQDGNGMPTRTRKITQNRESIDLDDIMGASDEDEGKEGGGGHVDEMGMRTAPAPRATPMSPNGPPKPYVSKAARDLIAFLDEGPPEELDPSRPSMANASVISFESSRSRSGRFSRMMSRLTIGGSMEKMNGRIGEDLPKTPKTPRALGRKASTNTLPPPPAFKAPSLSSKKSYPNVVVSPPRSLSSPTSPPPPILMQSVSSPTAVLQSPSPLPSLSPLAPPPLPRSVSATPSQTSSEESRQPSPSPRRGNVRKAVPPFDENEPRPPVPPLMLSTDTVSSRRESMRSQVNGVQHLRGDSPTTDERVFGNFGGADHALSVHTSLSYSPSARSKTPSPRRDEDRSMPLTPRRSTVQRKPPPSSIEVDSAVSSPVPSPTVSSKSRAKSSSKRRSTHSSITSAAVADLRRLLSSATSADECRLLVDMFFARQGYSYGAVAVDASDFPVPPPLNDAKLTTLGELECSLVELFLGGGEDRDDSEVCRVESSKLDTLTEAVDEEATGLPQRSQSLTKSGTEETLVDETPFVAATAQD